MFNQHVSIASGCDAQPARENQTASEMHHLGRQTTLLMEKVEVLTSRLHPLLTTPPGSIGDNDKESHIVPHAGEIRENRINVERANNKLDYILENIQI